ncbi:MAG: DNA-directed RNA polymerase subunit D [Candidatus Thermoplasmatota archaeon]
MKIEDVETDGQALRLVISGVDVSFVNSIRRALIADVPKMAIEHVEIHMGSISDEDGKSYESTNPLFDEILAHRLGLVPLPTDLSLYKFRSECDCGGEGCPTCTIMYSLNKKGPCTVYSGDMEPLGDAKLAPVDKLIPLTNLTKDEAILIYATAELGRGREHAKWQGVQGASYQHYPNVKISHSKCDNDGHCIDHCPKGVFARDKDGKVHVARMEECILCNACIESCARDAISVKGEDNKFIFRFETDGSLSPAAALLYALKYLEEEAERLRESVGEMEE